MIPILIVSPRRDRELSKLRRYRRNDRVVERPSYSGLGISSRASRGYRDRIGRPVYPRSRRIGAPDKETPPSAFFLEPIACTVAIIFGVYIISLGRSLIDSSRSPFLLLSRSLPLFSRIRCVTKLSRCPKASISIPNVATWLNVVRTSLVYLPLRYPCIAAGNFGPGCRSVLAGKEDDEAAFSSISRSHGRIEMEEEAPEWGRC